DRTGSDSDEEVNPNLNLKDDEEEETHDDEYICTPDYFVPTNEEPREENREFDEEEYDELYKDVNITSKYTELEKEGKGDAKMTYVVLENVSQEKTYEQVIDDAHITLTSTQKTEDNVLPTDSEVASMMNVKVRQEESRTIAPPILTVPMTAIPETFIVPSTTVPLTIQPFTPILQQSTPTPTLTTEPTTSSIPAILNFSSLFRFDQRVLAVEMELSQLKQSYTAEFEKKAQEEKDKYFDVIEKSIKGIIKGEVKSQLP
ncbi:hypothetical protein Tco_1267912, partial [Tanacetum coccineum]